MDADVFDAQGTRTQYGWTGPSPAFLVVTADREVAASALRAARPRLSRVGAHGEELDDAAVTGDAGSPGFVSDVHLVDHGLVLWTDTDGELTREMGAKMIAILVEELQSRGVSARICAPPAGLALGDAVQELQIPEMSKAPPPVGKPTPSAEPPGFVQLRVRFPAGTGLSLAQYSLWMEGLAAYVTMLIMPLLDERRGGFRRDRAGLSEDEFERVFNQAHGYSWHVRIRSVSMEPVEVVVELATEPVISASALADRLISTHTAFGHIRRAKGDPINAAVRAIEEAATDGRGPLPANLYPVISSTISAAARALTIIETITSDA